MPAPLADIVVGYLQEPIEAQRKRRRQLMWELLWHWKDGIARSGFRSWSPDLEHMKGCAECRQYRARSMKVNERRTKANEKTRRKLPTTQARQP